jgi:TrmH family RNA methyltransferase
VLTSIHNPLLKDVRRAASKGGLTSDGSALAEGFHLLEEALSSGAHIHAVIASESVRARVEERLSRREIRQEVVDDKIFAGLATSEATQGVLTLVRWKHWTLEELEPTLLVVLDQLQDPGNAGAVIRTAEAFGASGVVLTKGSVHAYNPKALRGSAGSAFRLPVVQGVSADEVVAFLKKSGAKLYAAMPRDGTPIADSDLRAPCAFAIGSEAHGVSEALSAAATPVRIPTAHVESLNAAVAAAVLLYEAQRQGKPHGPL